MKNHSIIFTLRRAEESDIPAITGLYRDTVRRINSGDYSEKQIEVWSSSAENYNRWKDAVTQQYFMLAETGVSGKNGTAETGKSAKILAGFCSICPDGYLDFLYISSRYQRQGAAKLLVTEIERRAAEQKNPEIYSHVSKTAKGFFEKTGYTHMEDLQEMHKGVLFVNALMVKKIF